MKGSIVVDSKKPMVMVTVSMNQQLEMAVKIVYFSVIIIFVSDSLEGMWYCGPCVPSHKGQVQTRCPGQ